MEDQTYQNPSPSFVSNFLSQRGGGYHSLKDEEAPQEEGLSNTDFLTKHAKIYRTLNVSTSSFLTGFNCAQIIHIVCNLLLFIIGIFWMVVPSLRGFCIFLGLITVLIAPANIAMLAWIDYCYYFLIPFPDHHFKRLALLAMAVPMGIHTILSVAGLITFMGYFGQVAGAASDPNNYEDSAAGSGNDFASLPIINPGDILLALITIALSNMNFVSLLALFVSYFEPERVYTAPYKENSTWDKTEDRYFDALIMGEQENPEETTTWSNQQWGCCCLFPLPCCIPFPMMKEKFSISTHRIFIRKEANSRWNQLGCHCGEAMYHEVWARDSTSMFLGHENECRNWMRIFTSCCCNAGYFSWPCCSDSWVRVGDPGGLLLVSRLKQRDIPQLQSHLIRMQDYWKNQQDTTVQIEQGGVDLTPESTSKDV